MVRVPKMSRGKISLARGFHCCPKFFFLFPNRRLYSEKNMSLSLSLSLYIYIYIYIYIHIHVFDSVQTVYELPLLSNDKAKYFIPLNPELNPICYSLALLGAHHFLHVSRIRVKLLNFRLLMS